jgi:predicted small integral membrane protein
MIDEQTTQPIPENGEPEPVVDIADVVDETEVLAPSLADADVEPTAELTETDIEPLPDEEPFAVPAHKEDFQPDYTLISDDVDIDAALAAVAMLSDGAAEREAQQQELQPLADSTATEAPTFLLPTPPAVTLKRGSLASLVPALLLIASGALLTVMTTSGAVISPVLVAFGALVAIAVLMLAYWLTARRWAVGTFFIAALLLLSSAAVYAILQPGGLGLSGLPLLITATGAALFLTAILTRPLMRRALVPALALIIGGIAAFAASSGAFDTRWLAPLLQNSWVLLLVLVALWLLPVLFRRRRA